MTRKLSEAQERALRKLDNRWQYPYTLGESRRTLDSLVELGLAERKHVSGGYLYRRAEV